MFTSFNTPPQIILSKSNKEINYFDSKSENIDNATVESFGEEWEKFDHFSDNEISAIAKSHYFDIVNEKYIINKDVLDVGCGSGRWSKYVSNLAASVDAIDPSKAIVSAATLLTDCNNVRLSCVSVDNLPFNDNAFDFVFSLGVLHHIPNTEAAMQKCIKVLKPGGYFLIYLYYNFDNRALPYKLIFLASTIIRKIVSRLPSFLKNIICDLISIILYMPFVAINNFMKGIGLNKLSSKLPLHFYTNKSFNVIRNDARDRFGTPLEQRFTKNEIRIMMENCGLIDIVFSTNEPYWHAIGKKK